MQLKFGLQKVEIVFNSRIPKYDLNRLFKSIQYNYFYILSEWKSFYGVDNIKFYC